jgi:hypothetical protein
MVRNPFFCPETAAKKPADHRNAAHQVVTPHDQLGPITGRPEAQDDQVVPTPDQLADFLKLAKTKAHVAATTTITNWAARQTAGPAVAQTLEAIITALPTILSHLARASPSKGAAPPGENNTESQ